MHEYSWGIDQNNLKGIGEGKGVEYSFKLEFLLSHIYFPHLFFLGHIIIRPQKTHINFEWKKADEFEILCLTIINEQSKLLNQCI